MPSDTFNLQIFDTGISIPALHATSHLTGGADAIPIAVASVAGEGGSAGLMSALQAQQLVTNNSKVTNAAHTGEVTGSTALTIANDAITTAKIALNAVIADKIASDAVTTTKIKDANVTLAKIQDVAQFTVLGRDADGTGGVSALSCSELGFDILALQQPLEVRGLLELGALATADSITINLASDVGSSKLPVVNGGTGGLVVQNPFALVAAGVSSNAPFRTLSIGETTQVLVGGGSGAFPVWTTATGSGAPVRAVSPTLTTPTLTTPTLTNPALGTPTAGVLTNCAGLPLTTGVTGVLPIANGGTGVTQSAYGECYLTTTTPVATLIIETGEYVKVAGTTTSVLLSNFTSSVDNRLTYTGDATRKFFVTAALSYHGVSDDFSFAIKKNNSSIVASSRILTTGDGANDLTHVSSQCIVELAKNDYVEVFVANAETVTDPTVDQMNLTAFALI